MTSLLRIAIPSSRLLLLLVLTMLGSTLGYSQDQGDQWPTYGGDPGGMRYTASRQITRENLDHLAPAWTFHTGALAKHRPGFKNASFEATPILFHGRLYLTSPYDEIYALDPETGAKVWEYDPKLFRNLEAGILTSRGVAAWASASPAPGAACSTRIFVATMDARLIAVDARDGRPCEGFGNGGTVDLTRNVFFRDGDPYYFSSPPTVIGNLVVVGSSMIDNQRVDIESGVVRAFDCVTGRLVWSWDPIPWAARQALRTGAANAWSISAVDLEHNLIYIPTGAPSSDFYGVSRPGDNRDANSVVALDASTGKRVWGFQVVHHDLWDYDVAAEPLLFTFRGKIPAIAITTKMGLLFVLNRLTGEPLYPITERPVPASDLPGENASPTQPFQEIASLSPTSIDFSGSLGSSPQDDIDCRKMFSALRYEGIYTPPSTRGTLAFPGNLGGVNWGGASLDPATGILYANTNRYAFSLKLVKRQPRLRQALDKLRSRRKVFPSVLALALIALVLLVSTATRRSLRPGRGAFSLIGLILIGTVANIGYVSTHPTLGHNTQHFGHEEGPQLGTPYTVVREQIIAPKTDLPCTAEPWGAVSAVNLNTGKAVWQTPLGTVIPGQKTGTINLGGDIVTASGLVFTGASEQPLLRAFDAQTGAELWNGALPAPAQSTPMSYSINGRQFVVIAAGGHGLFGTPTSDAVVAYALPAQP